MSSSIRSTARTREALACVPTHMCIRCGEAAKGGELSLCERCAIATCVEYLTGLDRLERYLGAWAAFQDWLEGRALQSV